MLKRHSKLVVLLVMVTFLFSFIASAGAATFTDVTGSSAEANAIYKLSSLGIVNGYTDGTFGADKTITRAEFAKIAVYTAGLQNVAAGMSASPSTFKDVKTSDWYNGWVNVAAAQGYVKGYPNGTFMPNATINQAEAVTVLLRILGYNDNLAGNWPSDYIAKAANLGVLDDITFDAYGAATRGTICVMASETLDQKTVTYVASDNYFTESANTLLVTKFKDWGNVVEKKLVTSVNLSDGKVRFTFKDMAANTTVTKEVSKDCVYANGTFWGDAAYRYVDYMLNDDGDVAYIKVRDYAVVKSIDLTKTTVKTTYASLTSPGEIKVDDKTYKIAANFAADNSDANALGTAFLGQAAGTYLDAFLLAGPVFKADGADLVLNGDGEVGFIRFFSYPSVRPTAGGLAATYNAVGVVDSTVAKSGKVSLAGAAGSFTLDPDEADDFYITKNGAPATFADIKAGDFIYSMNKFSTTFVVDFDVKVTGKLTAYEKNDATYTKKVTVGDKVYSIGVGTTTPADTKTAWFSTDNGDTYAVLTNTDTDDMLGKDVTLVLNPVGKVAAILTNGTGDAGKIYGVINSTGQTLANGAIQESIEVVKADGTIVSYTYDEDSDLNNGGEGTLTDAAIGAAPVVVGSFVEITLNAKGYIDTIKTNANISNTTVDAALVAPGDNITGDKDNNTVVIGGNTYDATGVVVFDLDPIAGGDDADIVKAADFIDAADSTLTAAADFTGTLIYKVKDGVLKYVVLDSASGIGGKGNLAMVAGTGTDADGDYALFLQKDGTTSKVYLDANANLAVKKALVYYDLGAGEADLTAWGTGDTATWAVQGTALTIDTISGNIIKFVGGAQYAVDADTLYFDCSDSDPAAATLSDLASGDIVKVYKDAGENIGAIVLQ